MANCSRRPHPRAHEDTATSPAAQGPWSVGPGPLGVVQKGPANQRGRAWSRGHRPQTDFSAFRSQLRPTLRKAPGAPRPARVLSREQPGQLVFSSVRARPEPRPGKHAAECGGSNPKSGRRPRRQRGARAGSAGGVRPPALRRDPCAAGLPAVRLVAFSACLGPPGPGRALPWLG